MHCPSVLLVMFMCMDTSRLKSTKHLKNTYNFTSLTCTSKALKNDLCQAHLIYTAHIQCALFAADA